MLQVLFSLYFFWEFYQRAKRLNRNPWGWSLAGGFTFIAVSAVFPDVITYAAYALGVDESGSLLAIRFIAVIVGLAVAYAVAQRLMTMKLPETIDPQPESDAPTDADVPADALGICPNCRASIQLQSAECPKCKASFGSGSAWKVEPL